jgi:two-component system, NtrC family, response regulator HydG
MKESTILLVDDDTKLLAMLAGVLRRAGHPAVKTLSDPGAVIPFLAGEEAALCILDLNMPGLSGLQLFQMIREKHPLLPVIIFTAVNEVEMAISCMKEGACDYLVKPVDNPHLIAAIATALEQRRVNAAITAIDLTPLPDGFPHEEAFIGIVTASDAIRTLFRYVEVIAPTTLPVTITGETGVGKELFARAVHDVSERKGPFVAVNVAGLDDLQFADSLFGHLRGAFTGADKARSGFTATAGGGTLFLDEIGDLRSESQVKLLRLLQENEYYPLGADTPRRCTARIVVATNRNLEKLVGKGAFREDLYYRLCAHRIAIPPLRSRLEDIPRLIESFIAAAARTLGKKRPFYPPELLTLLGGYGFPGNVRELQMMVFEAVARTTSGKLSLDTFKEFIGRANGTTSPHSGVSPTDVTSDHFPTMEEAEEQHIARALELSRGNQRIAAAMLGISRQALNNRLRRKLLK